MLIGPCCVTAMKTQASMRSRSRLQASMKLWVNSVSLWTRPRAAISSRRAFHAKAKPQRSAASASIGRVSPAFSSETAARHCVPRSMRRFAVSRMKRWMKASSSKASKARPSTTNTTALRLQSWWPDSRVLKRSAVPTPAQSCAATLSLLIASTRAPSTPRPVSACSWNEAKRTTSACALKNAASIGTSLAFAACTVVLKNTPRPRPRARSMYSARSGFKSASLAKPARCCVRST